MKHRSGSATASAVLAFAGLVAVGAAGYSLMTGRTLCSMFGACDKGAATAQAVSAGGDSCCPLSAAKVTKVASTKSGDSCCASSGEAKVVNAADVQSADDAAAEQCPHLRAMKIASQAAATEAKACEATASTCTSVKTAAVPASMVTWNVVGVAVFGAPFAAPVFHAQCGAVTFDCSVEAVSDSELVAAGGCGGAAACGDSKAAKVVTASATEAAAGCCKGKPAAECCKADGGACDGKCEEHGKETRVAKPAEPAKAPTSGM